MSEFELVIDLPGNQYSEILLINKYNDRYSIALGYKGKEGTNGMKWGFPQGLDRKPKEKAVPWSVPLGNRTESIAVIKQIAKAFGLEAK